MPVHARRRPLRRVMQWLLSRSPKSDAITLGQRRVYLLPTRAGWLLALTLLILLLTTINYQLNLGYILTFLIAGSALSSVFISYRGIHGLGARMHTPQGIFAGESAGIDISLINPSRRVRQAVRLRIRGMTEQSWAQVPAGGQVRLQIKLHCPRRGLQAIPPLVLETRYPIGVFRVWGVWRTATPILVYPAPEPAAPPLPWAADEHGEGLSASAHGGETYDGIRAYRHGDPLKRIVWKKFARSGELVSRDSPPQPNRTLWLDAPRTGLSDPEASLSRLTAWVLQADQLGLRYGLRLPGRVVEAAQGSAHRMRCLEALAQC